MGLDMSYNEININYNALSPVDPNDPYLYSDKSNCIYPQSGAGIQITNELFFLSLSAKNLLPNHFIDDKGFVRNAGDYYAYGGYTQRINRLFSVEPSAMAMKCDGLPFTWHANTKLYYKSYNWFSLSYESTGKVSANFMIQVSTIFDFGYGYELFINNVERSSYSGHNFYLGRNFGLRNVHGIRKNVKQSFL
jgi:type IX secretion system PorP/SprF family membrane protein